MSGTFAGSTPSAGNNTDWTNGWAPVNRYAQSELCYNYSNTSLLNGRYKSNGVALSSFAASDGTAHVFDLSSFGSSCSKYQLILVTNGQHVPAGVESHVWSFLTGYTLP